MTTWKLSAVTVLATAAVTSPALPESCVDHSRYIPVIGETEEAGELRDVVVRAPYAYAGSDDGLRVFDVSVPEAPVLVATSQPISDANRHVIAGDYVYLAAMNLDLLVVDVSSPESPTLLPQGISLSGLARDVAVKDDIVYVAAWSELHILEISTNPGFPQYVTTLAQPASELAVGGDLLAVGRAQTLYLFDVSVPASPVLRSSVDITLGDFPSILDIDLFGDRAYVASNRGVSVIDISDPDQPVELGGTITHAAAEDVAVAPGDRVVLCSDGATLVDVSAPATMAPVANQYFGAALSLPFETTSGVAVDGELAYFASGRGLHVVDLATETSYNPIFSIDVPRGAGRIAAVPSGEVAYLQIDSDLNTLDFSVPHAPVLMPHAGVLPSSTITTGLAIDGPTMYITGQTNLTTVDISDPAQPAHVGFGSLDETSRPVLVGDYLYVLRDDDVEIVDVSKPFLPNFVGAVGLSNVTAFHAAGGVAAMARLDNQVVFADVSSPLFPTIGGTVALLADPLDVRVGGGAAYVSSATEIQVFDVTDPSAPQSLGSIPVSANALDWVSGVLYASSGPRLVAVDVSDPSSPVVAETIRQPVFEAVYIAATASRVFRSASWHPSCNCLNDGAIVTAPGHCGSSTVSAPVLGVPQRARLEVSPNPFTELAAIRIPYAFEAATRVDVFDVTGRLVRALSVSGAGLDASVLWDARDESGVEVAAGVYIVRLQQGERTFDARVVKVD